MNRALKTILGAGLAALVAVPILAQQSDRPSRGCVREIVKLCGRDRSKIYNCLQERLNELSEDCAEEIRERAKSRQRPGQGAATRQPATQYANRADRTVIYGNDRRQQIDVYEPEGAVDEFPLVLHIHGGGWSFGNHKLVQAKPAHFTGQDYYFASAGYRLLPDAPVEEQAADIGAAIQALRGQAASIGFAADKIVVMGHSAGAHLAALVATDPSYAGDAFDAIKGVILLDGAGYDIASSMESADGQAADLYLRAFGNDAERHERLSPLSHAGGRDAPNWLALYVDGRKRSQDQSELLVSALSSVGGNAKAIAISDTDHGRLNRDIGTEAGIAQTQAIDAFLARVLG